MPVLNEPFPKLGNYKMIKSDKSKNLFFVFENFFELSCLAKVLKKHQWFLVQLCLLPIGLGLTSCAILDRAPPTEQGVIAHQLQFAPIDKLSTNPFNSKAFVERILRFAVEQNKPADKSTIEALIGAKVSFDTCADNSCSGPFARAYYRFETATEKKLYAQYFFSPNDLTDVSGLHLMRVPAHRSTDKPPTILNYWSVNDLIAKYHFVSSRETPSPHSDFRSSLRYQFAYGFLTIYFESADFDRAEIIRLEITWRTPPPTK